MLRFYSILFLLVLLIFDWKLLKKITNKKQGPAKQSTTTTTTANLLEEITAPSKSTQPKQVDLMAEVKNQKKKRRKNQKKIRKNT